MKEKDTGIMMIYSSVVKHHTYHTGKSYYYYYYYYFNGFLSETPPFLHEKQTLQVSQRSVSSGEWRAGADWHTEKA